MNISLKQDVIEVALKQYIQARGIIGEVANIEFTAGRSANGLTVEIELSDDLVKPEGDIPTPQAVAPDKPAKVPKPVKSKTKVVEPTVVAKEEEATPEAEPSSKLEISPEVAKETESGATDPGQPVKSLFK